MLITSAFNGCPGYLIGQRKADDRPVELCMAQVTVSKENPVKIAGPFTLQIKIWTGL